MREFFSLATCVFLASWRWFAGETPLKNDGRTFLLLPREWIALSSAWPSPWKTSMQFFWNRNKQVPGGRIVIFLVRIARRWGWIKHLLVSVHVLESSSPKPGKMSPFWLMLFKRVGLSWVKARPPEDVIFSAILGFDMPAHWQFSMIRILTRLEDETWNWNQPTV